MRVKKRKLKFLPERSYIFKQKSNKPSKKIHVIHQSQRAKSQKNRQESKKQIKKDLQFLNTTKSQSTLK